jgi:histidine ammonia-lyase
MKKTQQLKPINIYDKEGVAWRYSTATTTAHVVLNLAVDVIANRLASSLPI